MKMRGRMVGLVVGLLLAAGPSAAQQIIAWETGRFSWDYPFDADVSAMPQHHHQGAAGCVLAVSMVRMD